MQSMPGLMDVFIVIITNIFLDYKAIALVRLQVLVN